MAIVIGLQLLLVILLIRYFVTHDKGPREPLSALIFAGVVGFYAVIIGVVLEFFIIPSTALPDPGKPATHVGVITILLACLAIGVIEELSKAVPLKRFLADKSYFNEISDGIIYFGITGLIFGALENISYAFAYGASVGLMRVISIPFMHASFTSIIGYAIARQKVLNLPRRVVTKSFILAIGLHAFYDFGLYYNHAWSRYAALILTVFINFAVIYLYRRASREDAARVVTTTYPPSAAGPNLV